MRRTGHEFVLGRIRAQMADRQTRVILAAFVAATCMTAIMGILIGFQG